MRDHIRRYNVATMEREVRYCTTEDGVRIAYCVEGQGSPYLLCSEPTVSHVQLETSRPVLGPALVEIARHNRLIRFDMRGTGLSDRVLPQTLDETTLDIEAVVERTCPQEFALGCIQLVTPAAIAFAARHPDRITRMVIFDGYANTKDLFMTPQVQALVAAAQMDWGIATEAIGSMVFGAGRDETRDWGAYIRSCVAPETFAEDYVRIFSMFDSSDLAPRITAPTLILRHDGLQFITMDMAKDLAARIPNAQLVVVPGTWVTEPEALMRRVAAFINGGVEKTLPGPALLSGSAVILFTDIVNSTALTEQLGDAAFRERARQLDEAMRVSIREANGTTVDGKLLGDGVLAVFSAARDAISAALTCRDDARAAGLELHLGIHAGDVIRENDNVYGGAVNVAARICGLSAPGEILVSDVVRGMARTSAGAAFHDCGEQTLKGIEDPIRIYEVRSRR